MSDPNGSTSVTFDELEAQQKADEAPKASDLTQIKLEGDDVPERLRGKTAADALNQVKSLEEALRLSEQARVPAPQAPAPLPPEPEEPADLTSEQLAELHSENPIKAMEVMQAQAERRAQKNLEHRLAPIAAGASAQVEAAARAKYADEFALFGDQISSIAAQIPNARAVLTNPAAWDDLIAIVRGRGGNFERLLEHKASGGPVRTRTTAQQEQVDSVGFTDTSAGSRRIPTSVAQLDPVQLEIAAKMNLTPAEYIKWSKV